MTMKNDRYVTDSGQGLVTLSISSYSMENSVLLTDNYCTVAIVIPICLTKRGNELFIVTFTSITVVVQVYGIRSPKRVDEIGIVTSKTPPPPAPKIQQILMREMYMTFHETNLWLILSLVQKAPTNHRFQMTNTRHLYTIYLPRRLDCLTFNIYISLAKSRELSTVPIPFYVKYFTNN